MTHPEITILEQGTFYPHYCRNCRWEWYGKEKIKMQCPKCGEIENVCAALGCRPEISHEDRASVR